ncbi:MAG: guanine deaminase [Verrucomicrobia bacterium]|nr:guanine deaminase [Verrucomicrobiota bacterium]
MTPRPIALRGFVLDAPTRHAARGIPDGAILIENGRIAARGTFSEISKLPAAADAEWLGGPDCAVVPGLIDIHAHIPQYPFVARIEESLLPWLKRYIFPAEKNFRAAEARAFAPFFFESLACNGTTLAVLYAAIHEDSAHECFAAAEASGIRAIIGKVMMDRHSYGDLEPDKILPVSIEQTRRLIQRWHGAAGGRLEYAVSPRFAVSCSAEMMRAAADLAREHGTWVQTHLSENHLEIETVRALFPEFPDYTSVYEGCGLLGPKTILGHCIHLSPAERAKLRASGSIIAHCPTSNLFLRSGTMPWDTIVEDGIPFGLASDVAGGPELSMWRVMRSALESQIARSFSTPCRIPFPAEIFHQSTQGAAEALGKGGQLGTLDPGKEADAVLIDLSEIIPSVEKPLLDPATTAEDLLPLLIHRAGPKSTLATLAAGKKIHLRK